ncbi:MAG: two pore domain potassium channel family protein [Sphingomonadales bacterium]|nr:two pore domain potassium channel family protein [Sphingomonadales bacterium]MDE2169903.1 two pore domain potassium channel family protein [Sphingomonadales bacterium]
MPPLDGKTTCSWPVLSRYAKEPVLSPDHRNRWTKEKISMDAAMPRPPHVDWSLTTLLMVQTVTLFVAVPLATQYPQTHILLDICRLLYAIVCAASLTRHRLLQFGLLVGLAVLIAGPVLTRMLMAETIFAISSALQHDLIEISAFGFNLGATVLVARHVFGPGRVTAHRVRGAVLVYLNMAALFGIAYGAILAHWPGSIMLTTGAPMPGGPGLRAASLTYFSLSTITTTGFGDVVPVMPLARSLANLESVIGQLFPATLLARIVALNLEHSREDD